MPAIPLEDTSLVSDFNDIYQGTLAEIDSGDDPLPVGDGDYIYLERPDEYTIEGVSSEGEGGSDPITLLPGDYRLTPNNIVKMVLHGKSTIVPWRPFTHYEGLREHYSTGNPVRAPDVVFHNNSLYFCLMDFESGGSFSVFDDYDEVLQLSRLTLDTDLQYLELTSSIKAPIAVGDELLTYALGRREMRIYNYYSLPFPNDGGVDYRRAICNGDITTTSVFNINRLSDAAGLETIGTITFEPNGHGAPLIEGVFDITDSRGGGDFILMRRDEVLIIEALTVGIDLAWVRLNILGEFISYRSPYLSPIQPPI